MISGYFGLPGCGKTTFLASIAQKELRRIKKGKSKYKKVYTNFWCDGCLRIDYKHLGNFDISDALILLDEITLDADSRNFKQFDEAHKYFFLLHRHYNCDLIYFTQFYDGVDKKIRDITNILWHVKRVGPFSIARQIFRILDINEQTKEIVQGYRFSNFFELLFLHPFRICYRPLWYKYFDSFERKELPEFKDHKWSDRA
nr:unnamed protein product [uncultured bacterium]